MTPVVDVTDRRCTRICWWSCHSQASSWPKSSPSIQPTWTSTTCSPWTPSCTNECLHLCVCVCVCLPVLHHLDIHHLQSMAPVSVSVSVCVSQYSTNLDIHHLQSMAPLYATVYLSSLSACPKTAPTWTPTSSSSWPHYMQVPVFGPSSSSLNLLSKR